MSAIGPITLVQNGQIALPSSYFQMLLPTVETQRLHGTLPMSFVDLPEIRGFMFSDGQKPLRHVVTNILRTGPLAPQSALVATSTATRATATLTASANLTDVDEIELFDLDLPLNDPLGGIVFKATLSAAPVGIHEVKIGANLATTLLNLTALVMGTGTQGVEYIDANVSSGGAGDNLPFFVNHSDIEVSSTTGTVVTFRSKTGGTSGNDYRLVEIQDTGAVYAVVDFASGTAGTGVAPAAGVYRYLFQHGRKEDGAMSGPSPTTAFTNAGNWNVTLSDMLAAVDADPDFKRWSRTLTSGSQFIRGYDVPEADTGDTDNISDSTLATRFGAVILEEDKFRTFSGGYPPKCRFLVRYNGQVFGFGHVPAAPTSQAATMRLTFVENSQAFTVTAGSRFVLTKDMEGRSVGIPGSSWEPYRIVSVTTEGMEEDGAGGILERVWEHTGTGALCQVIDDLDPYEAFYTPVGAPNQWPPTYSFKSITGKSVDGVTGAVAAFDSIIVFTRDDVWRITGSHPAFQAHKEVAGTGTVSGRSVVEANGALWWIAQDRTIRRWGGSGEADNVTGPIVTPTGVWGIKRTMDRLNLAHAAGIVGHYDQQSKVIRWFVPMDSDQSNRHAVVYHLDSGVFSLDNCEYVTECKTVRTQDGTPVTLMGNVFGSLFQLDAGDADGVYGWEGVQTPTGATSGLVTTFATITSWAAILPGVPMWTKDASGNVARRCLVSMTATTATSALVETQMDTTYQVAIGRPCLDLESAYFTNGVQEQTKVWDDLDLSFDVKTYGDLFVATCGEQGVPKVRIKDPVADLAIERGVRTFNASRVGGSFKYRLLSFDPCAILSMRLVLSLEEVEA